MFWSDNKEQSLRVDAISWNYLIFIFLKLKSCFYPKSPSKPNKEVHTLAVSVGLTYAVSNLSNVNVKRVQLLQRFNFWQSKNGSGLTFNKISNNKRQRWSVCNGSASKGHKRTSPVAYVYCLLSQSMGFAPFYGPH